MFHQSLPHWKHDKWLSQICSFTWSHVYKTSSVASTWLRWDNEVSWQKTEKSKVTLGCMYMSVKCIGKGCYVQNKSSKPVKWIILNLCINYHTIRWFATSRMSSSLSSYDRLCMNEIETGAECNPRNPETWLACDSRNEPAEDGSRRPYRPFWEPCHQTGYDRNHLSKNADLFTVPWMVIVLFATELFCASLTNTCSVSVGFPVRMWSP